MEIAANGVSMGSRPATHPALPKSEEPVAMVRKKPDDTADLTIISRASQNAVDFTLIFRNCGIPGIIMAALCAACYWAIPWWGENISKPESAARISAMKSTADALTILAETSKELAAAETNRKDFELKISTQFSIIADFMTTIDKRLNHKDSDK